MVTTSPASGPPTSVAGSSSAIDPRYMVTLTSAGEGGENFQIYTTVDETLAISLASQWAAPFENVLQEAAGAGAAQQNKAGAVIRGASATAAALGLKVKSRATSFQTWQSSDPITFTIPFTFVAQKSAATDVRDKVIALLKMVAPTQFLGILRAPGPTLLDAITGGRDVTLEIGKYIKLEKCIITNVQVQFDNVIGEEGIPLRAKATVDIKSWYTCFTTQDIDALFLKSSSGGSTPGEEMAKETAKAQQDAASKAASPYN